VSIGCLINVGDPSYVEGNLENWQFQPIKEGKRFQKLGIVYHNDPEFETFTYGDYSYKGAKANLGRLSTGDYIFFHETLIVKGIKGRYFIGYFFLIEILPFSLLEKRKLLNKKPYSNNAHVKRNLWMPGSDVEFTLFVGHQKKSKRLSRPLAFDRKLVQKTGLLKGRDGGTVSFNRQNKSGKPLSDLEIISMYTRNTRLIDAEVTKLLLKSIQVGGAR